MCIYKTGGKVYKCSTEEMMILSLCILALSLSLASSQHCPLMDCASDRIDISNQDEERFLRSITCQDYCIRQYGVKLPNVSVFNVWPTRDISDLQHNCYMFQKVEQCQFGCIISLTFTGLTTKKCRNKCYSLCQDSCNGESKCSINSNTCPRKCGKTFCKKGCLYKRQQNTYKPPAPVTGPILSQTNEELKYKITYNHSQKINNNNNTDWVNFLFKVKDLNDGLTRYYWLSDLTQTLKLTGLSCRIVNVSMSVISRDQQTLYSPQTTLCINNNKVYPSLVKAETITVSYKEDKEHLSFAIMIIQWQHPKNPQAVTSYGIHILSKQDECGGINKLFSYEIKQNNITIKPDGMTRFPRFGCTYYIQVKVYPSKDDRGTQITLTPKLPEFEGDMELNCSSVRLGNGPLLLTVNWSTKKTEEAIGYFILNIKNEKEIKIKANTSQSNYRVSRLLSDIKGNFIQANLSLLRNPDYYWRTVPYPSSCVIPIPVYMPLSVSVKLYNNTPAAPNLNVTLNISWSISDSYNITHIQLLIGRELESPSHSYTVEAHLKSFFINITRLEKDAYLWARSIRDEAIVSSWNNPITIKTGMVLL